LEKVRHQVIATLGQQHPATAETATAGGKASQSKTPTLDQLGVNLTAMAKAQQLDPVIGREKEIERVIQILSRRTKNNPALIGEPTLDEFRKYIERDAALERRFQPVMVEEPTIEETIAILMGIRSRYEDHHKVAISDDAVKASAELSSRYITDRFLPDKAIDLMDEAASRVRLRYSTVPTDVKDAQRELDRVVTEKEQAMEAQQYELASTLRQQERAQQD